MGKRRLATSSVKLSGGRTGCLCSLLACELQALLALAGKSSPFYLFLALWAPVGDLLSVTSSHTEIQTQPRFGI